jgi:small-conductance mechanosensitive channel
MRPSASGFPAAPQRAVMKRIHVPAVALAVLLAGCLAALYWTRDTGTSRILSKPASNGVPSTLVDTRLVETARRMAALADSAEEQDLVRQALQLGDKDADQAFATAMREAAGNLVGPPNPAVLDASARLKQARDRVAAGETRVAQLTKQAETSQTAADQLDLVQAQLALDKDEADDAQQEFERVGGDRGALIQRELQRRQTTRQQAPPMPKVVSDDLSTLKNQIQTWFELRAERGPVEEAQQQAASYAAQLTRQHDGLAAGLKGTATDPAATGDETAETDEEAEDTALMIDRLRHLSDQTKTLSELAKRADVAQRIADVYKRWGAELDSRQQAAVHAALSSAAAILGVLLAAVLAIAGIRRVLEIKTERRRRHQLRVMAAIAVEVTAALSIALIIFGPPTQMTTMIGLATAGLTVVLKDFIVAFFGWFVLMGRNGIRVGDWVEIEGVGGEVIEIGLLRTWLLEMGNWTATGHPTGRRVAFVNSFAIERHYFNFSTAGQWLWDELLVSLPASGDPHLRSRQISEIVERETAEDAAQAESEWERVTHKYGVAPFKARPAVSLRPTASGFEALVRYITRAPRRVEMKSRLYQGIIDLLRKPEDAQ